MSDETRVLAEARDVLVQAVLDTPMHPTKPSTGELVDIELTALAEAGYSIVPTATLEALERVRDAAQAVLELYGYEPDRPAVRILRAALEGGLT